MVIKKQQNGLTTIALEVNKHYTLKKSNKTGRTRIKLKRKFKKDLVKAGIGYNFLWGKDIPPQLTVSMLEESALTFLSLKW